MKVRMFHDYDSGWYESDDEIFDPLIELPDAIITEWRALKARLEEIETYFDERIPPLQKEADAEVPQEPTSPIANQWAKTMLEHYLADTEFFGCLIPKKDAAD